MTPKFKCQPCTLEFVIERRYIEHRKEVHSDPKPFQCSKCHFKCRTRWQLQMHESVHLEVKPHKCTMCPATFGQKRQLVTHSQKHTVQTIEKCRMCNEKFSSKDALEEHLVTHAGLGDHSCEVCGFTAPNAGTLAMHMRSHAGNRVKFHGKRILSCHLCPFTTPGKDSLLHHVKSHNYVRHFKCTHCSKFYSTKAVLTKHMRTHGVGRPIMCKICQQQVKGNIRVHMNTHMEWRSQQQCPVCANDCGSKNRLTNHMRRFHPEREQFKCHLCECEFSNTDELAVHLRKHGSKSYTCQICCVELQTLKLLKCHSAIHQPQPEVTQRQNDLPNSEDQGQMNELNFKFTCPFCDTGFNCIEEFGKHVKIHTKEDSDSSTAKSRPVTSELRVVLTRLVLAKANPDIFALS